MIPIESIPWIQFEENYRNLGGLLFEDCVSEPGYTICDHYSHPIEEIPLTFSRNQNLKGQIHSLFDRLDLERKKGNYPCGILNYELGYHFIEGLDLESSPLKEGTPLLHITIYQNKKRSKYKNPDLKFDSLISISNPKPKWSKDEYTNQWEKTLEYLKLGESYELNLCFPVEFQIQGDLFSYYQNLKAKQKTKYSVFYPYDGKNKTIVSLSPELFFEVNGETITTEPMKGTIVRGNTKEEDQKNFLHLQTSEKERAENVMITDLYRNDLGRIAKQGTVVVEELFSIRGLSTVWQMVSQVTAKLDKPFSWNTVLSSLFPSGSVIGAPKRNSYELLRSLEFGNRGVYTGAFFTSEETNHIPQIRACVTIRTLETESNDKSHKAIYGIGSGVTVLSKANEEYEECLSKLKVLTSPVPPTFQILETMKVSNGKIFLKEHHGNRLESTAKRFGFSFSKTKLEDTFHKIETEVTGKVRIRLLLDEEGNFHWEKTPLPKRSIRPTIQLGFAKEPINSDDVFLYHKTTNRDVYNHLTDVCKELGFDDCILFDKDGRVLETTIRNLFYREKGKWFTPSLETGGLPGVFREWLLKKSWVKVKPTTRDDLLRAEAILVGNSVRGFERVTLVTK
ncbi:bifunctional anthranilate synthase component I family protein/class IV aminotransferase [Leptospira levettii]|uniref:bifunctional chorismate-binding protein/class IV aminotransferase n=1 Tax=Leptospira levettii TaxID=2023178 RepID=UPI00223E6E30|nr:bifunctional anthranilate synthase component I family protein/class IV aminotransferase [Leptospira levettii]MCW7506282.1 bifunctional anthranilate synthase component I family protein/class IV aminotransferase [Leptospira levettii]MCW7517372.1 bifunctional anthranilate synthase component I family protein/class IV aminotransferase [Leptospira levettii]